jgi:hypothetical protein
MVHNDSYEGLMASDLPETFGRGVYEPMTGEERLTAWRQIMETDEPARVDGVMVNVQWAAMICYLHDDLAADRQTALIETKTADVAELVRGWAT